MDGTHNMPLKITKFRRWDRDPLRLIKINCTPVAIAHWTSCPAGITFKAGSEFINPEFPPLRLGHFCQLVKHFSATCINFNLELMYKCFNFSKISEFN